MVGSRTGKLPPGIPGLLYLELINYGRGTQLHLEKMVHLEKAYALERGYLPAFYEKKKDIGTYDGTILPLLTEASSQIEIMNEHYDPTFEDIATCKPEEKNFNKIMRGVFERIVYIAAVSGMIDSNVIDESSEVFG